MSGSYIGRVKKVLEVPRTWWRFPDFQEVLSGVVCFPEVSGMCLDCLEMVLTCFECSGSFRSTESGV